MRVGRSSAFARVRREAPEGLPARVAHSPCGEARAGTRSVGWSGAGARSPCGEARNRSRCGGRTGMGARSLTGGAEPVTLWRADRRRCTLPLRGGARRHTLSRVVRRRCTLPLRRGACRSRCGGRDRRRCTLPLRRRRMPVTLWWADRRRCTLPLRRGACRSRSGGRTGTGARSPCGEARADTRCGGRTGAGARSPCGEALAGHAVEGGPAQVHAPLAALASQARNIGGAYRRRRDRTYVRTLTINPLDKVCQVSLAREIGCGWLRSRGPRLSPPSPQPSPSGDLCGTGADWREGGGLR